MRAERVIYRELTGAESGGARAAWVREDVAAAHGLGDAGACVGRLLGAFERGEGWEIKRDGRSVVRRVELGPERVQSDFWIGQNDRSGALNQKSDSPHGPIPGPGSAWIVKQYLVGSAIKRWVYRLARRTPGWREWDGALRLARIGVRCVQPLALAHGAGGKEWIILPLVAGAPLDQLIAALHGGVGGNEQRAGLELSGAQRLAIARAVGSQFGRMTARGVVNRDYKPSNLIVQWRERAGEEPTIIDPAGLRHLRGRLRGQAGGREQVHRALATLLRAARWSGHDRRGEWVACLAAALRADRGLIAPGSRPLRRLAEAVWEWYEVGGDVEMQRRRYVMMHGVKEAGKALE